MLKNPKMEKLRAKISPENSMLMEQSFALANRIHSLLEKNGITQRQLAEKLNKSESEISKWLSGGHNLTYHTIIKIGLAIGEPVMEITSDSKIQLEDIEKLASSLKSSILRVFKQHINVDFEYQKFNEGISDLEVTSNGVVAKKKVEHTINTEFVIADIKPEIFKNIELSSLN